MALRNIEMPDGTIIEDVPEGVSKEDLKAKLVAAGHWNPAWDETPAAEISPVQPPASSQAPESAPTPLPPVSTPAVGATSSPAPDIGPDNSPAAVAAADARMASIVKNGYSGPTDIGQESPLANLIPDLPGSLGFTPLAAPLSAMKTLNGNVQGALAKFANGYTSGLGDEISGGMAALPLSAATGMSIPDSYNKATANIRGSIEKVDKEKPALGMGLETAGGVLSVMGAKTALGALAKKFLPAEGVAALSKFAESNPKKAAALVSGLVGGAYGFGNAEGDIGDRMGPAAVSAAISAPLGPLVAGAASMGGSALSKIGNKVLPAEMSTALNELIGQVPATVNTVAPKLTPAQSERAQVLKDVGIDNPTAAMVSRDPKTWQFERNTAGINGVGDEIRQRYIDSNATIKDALESLGKSTGGKATTPYEAGGSVVDAVTAKSQEMQKEIGGLYTKIADKMGQKQGLRPAYLLTELDNASDNAYADNIVSSVTRKLKRMGALDGAGEAVGGIKGTLTISQAEELRKFANSLRGDRQTDPIVSKIVDSIDNDVFETASADAFKPARDAARARFQEFENKMLGGIVEGNVVADDVLRKTVYGGKVRDMEALKSTLLSGDENQIARGSQAWSDLKLQAVKSILDNSVNEGGKLSGTGLNRQLEKIGKERLETLFNPEELMRLKTIQKAAEYTTIEVPESFVNHSNTGAANVNNALSGVLQGSKIGDFMESAGDKLARIPFAGPVTSIPGALIRSGGKTIKASAQAASAKNAANPFATLLNRSADSVVNAGGFGGLLGNQFAPRDQ